MRPTRCIQQLCDVIISKSLKLDTYAYVSLCEISNFWLPNVFLLMSRLQICNHFSKWVLWAPQLLCLCDFCGFLQFLHFVDTNAMQMISNSSTMTWHTSTMHSIKFSMFWVFCQAMQATFELWSSYGKDSAMQFS